MMTAFEQAWRLLKEDPLKTRSDQLAQTPLGQALTAAREAPKPQPLDFSQPGVSNYPRVGDLMERIQRGQDRRDDRAARDQSFVDGTYQPKNYTVNPDNTYLFDEKQNGGDEQ